MAASLWGVSGAVAAGAFEQVATFRVAQSRFVVAALLLVPFAVWKRAIPPSGTRVTATLFGLNVAVLTGVFYTALDRLGVGPGATIEFLGPILVLLWMKY
ncbi:MAG TPA: EamA family transporter, partial [Acidimicrobiia bacterium]